MQAREQFKKYDRERGGETEGEENYTKEEKKKRAKERVSHGG